MKIRNIAFWACQILGWGLYSAIGISAAIADGAWHASILIAYGLFFVYSIGLTWLLRREIVRRQWLNLPVRQFVPRLAAASLITGSTIASLVFGFNLLLEHNSRNRFDLRAIPWLFIGVNGVTLLWTMLYVSLKVTERYRYAQLESLRLQLALKESELRALEAQINPHFLFNCLNTIRGMIAENPPQAQDMVTKLAEMLRYSLQRDRTHTVPLNREMEAVSNYLALEEARFEDRIQIRYSIDPDASEFPVPPMMLQTLVENAVNHGIAQRPEGGDVSIRAGLEGGSLALEVENTGHLSDGSGHGTRTGLRNVRERLRLLYGDRAAVTLANSSADHVKATVTIPA
jgi:sensor histidine kinase YesM